MNITKKKNFKVIIKSFFLYRHIEK